MEFGSDVPCTTAIKKVRETIKTQMYIGSGAKNPPWGFTIGGKTNFPNIVIIYQSIANFMYFQKTIKTICSKLTETPLLGKISPGGPP